MLLKEVSLSASLHKEPAFQRFVEFKGRLEEKIRSLKVVERVFCFLILVSALLLSATCLGTGSLLGVYVPSVAIAATSFACLIFLSMCFVGLSRYRGVLLSNKRKMEKVIERIRQYDRKASEVSQQRESFVKDFLQESVSLAVHDFKTKELTKIFLRKSPIGVDPLMDEWVETAFVSSPHIKQSVRQESYKIHALSKMRRLYPSPRVVQYAGQFLAPWRVKPEFEHRTNPELAITIRCKREWLFILLGFFTLRELEELAAYCKSFSSDLADASQGKDKIALHDVKSAIEMVSQRDSAYNQCNDLYAACIKKFPKLVAAEVAYFFWLQQSFPYLFSAKDSLFFKPFAYCSAFFDSLMPFSDERAFCERERKGLKWLSQFQGIIPACLSLFDHREVEKGSSLDVAKTLMSQSSLFEEESADHFSRDPVDYRFMEEWGWTDFCDATMEYCSETLFRRDRFGSLQDLLLYVQRRDESRRDESRRDEESAEHMEFSTSSADFFERPAPLWAMNTLCNRDSELSLKIEEGLQELHRSGYLGAFSVEEMRAFAREILGLDRSE